MSDLGFTQYYKVGKKLGEGGFGSVYECTNTDSDTKYAVKIFSKEQSKSSLKEADVMLKLKHDMIPRIFDVYPMDQNNHGYIVMEKCPGYSLKLFLFGCEKVSESKAFIIMRQLFAVLSHIHSQGYAHLDIKPGNIIIDPETDSIKLIDFGFATNKVEKCTQYNGSMPYVSPEIFYQEPFDARKADVWAAGLIFYYLIAGDLPWKDIQHKPIGQAIDLIMNEPIEYPPEIFSRKARTIVEMALEKDPVRRATSWDILEVIKSYRPPKSMRPRSISMFTSVPIIRPILRKSECAMSTVASIKRAHIECKTP